MSESRPYLDPGLALIFDMDGVIVDSNPIHREAWAAFNRGYGLETTEAMHEFMYGKRNDEIVRHYFGADLSDAETTARGAAKEAVYRDMIRARLDEILVPGLKPFLEDYRGAPMGLASNAEPANIELVLELGKLRPYFKAIVDGHQVLRPKPDPEIYLKVAKVLGIPPANCIIFEDSAAGVQAGLAAGMRVVLLRTTHDNLPGTSITVDNFLSWELRRWLASERVAAG